MSRVTRGDPVTQERRRGRPTLYSAKLVDDICALLTMGRSLVQICDKARMPGYRTVQRWLAEHVEFRHMYARAREDQADLIAAEVLEIADAALETSESINQARVRIDARKWYAGKLRPKVYGNRFFAEHPRVPDDPPLIVKTTMKVVRPRK